jgi:hypothetical protein
MENAERLTHEIAQQQVHLAAEPPQPQELTLEQTIAHLPERAKTWVRNDPRFITDPEKASQLQYAHWVARRETGEEFTPA